MQFLKIFKKKKFSIIELCLYIVLLPISVGVMSAIIIHTNNVSKAITHNSELYANMQQIISSINSDFQTAYKLEVFDDKISIHNNKGKVNYYFSNNDLFRENKRLGSLNKFEINDITTSSNKYSYPLYEITLEEDMKDIKNKDYPFKISTKVSMPTRK